MEGSVSGTSAVTAGGDASTAREGEHATPPRVSAAVTARQRAPTPVRRPLATRRGDCGTDGIIRDEEVGTARRSGLRSPRVVVLQPDLGGGVLAEDGGVADVRAERVL